MRYESKQIADALATSATSDPFTCEHWRDKTVQSVGAGEVLFEGTIDGANWSELLGGNVVSPFVIPVPETVQQIRVTGVGAGPFDVWIAGFNTQA